ncbi:acyltransferase ChoActase/COT/CPT [Wallemia mellicola]|uniref:Acyltransferase ChoActase/COT/CPT n=1 Tax=Wallemia mellicola TaxID=1708541 RepID=A0A4T0NIU1_9BASI|nr:acyltransferase ChoActase/COT/CPT [Wallemia mellicola]TIC07664.1 acyltransferase ChoActase/COT/CPT [Wallemia mellicola]
MGEHSAIDGTPVVRFCEFILENIEKFLHRLEEPVDQSIANARTDISMPLHLPFNESGLEASINEARDEVAKLSDNQALGYTVINGGKSIIKENGLSPDAWAQLIIQLAYSRLVAIEGSENVPAATYEAATMRSIINGRYECIRSTTSDSATFVDAMNNTKKTNADRKDALKTAVNTHVRNTKQVSSGHSVDRHLFGTDVEIYLQKSLYPSEQVPELFIDELFKKSSTWAILLFIRSTSQISTKGFETYGWGEVVPHGFGVAYSIFENCLQFTVTNTITYGTTEDKNGKGKKRNDTIVALLDEAAKDMLILLKPAQRQAKL